MPQSITRINSILGGIGASQYFVQEGQYLSGVGIDPDLPLTSSDVRTSGVLVPTVYEKFSGSNVTSSAIAIINNPKNTLTYIVLTNGRLISYDSSLGSETLVGTVATGIAQGAFYYNNYIYITTGVDVSRYGPLNNSPSLTDTVWTGGTLGSQTALTNTTYPSLRNVAIPNHWGTVHSDGSSYFLDFKNGQGMVHRINTKKGTSEGDTNGTTVPSAYNVLDLPFGFYPTSISSYGTDLAILAIQTTDTTVNQGKANLFLWDPTNTDTFYRQFSLPDPLGTALLYINGNLYIWTGNAQNGCRLSKYLGGDSVTDIEFLDEGVPPFAGAVDALGNRIVWGGYLTTPTNAACVYGYGSKDSSIPRGLHAVVKTTSTTASGFNVTAVKFSQQASNITPRVIAGWIDNSTYGVDRLSTSGTYSSVWRSAIITVGARFKVIRLRIPLGAAVAANMSIVPKIFYDDGSSSDTLPTINNTNYTSSQRVIVFKAPKIDPAKGGLNNFFIEFTWAGTVALPVLLPIEIEVTTYEDDVSTLGT